MKEVTQEQFYKEIYDRKLDVCVSIENEYNYPFTSLFKFRNGNLWGKIVDKRKEGAYWPIISTYYIN